MSISEIIAGRLRSDHKRFFANDNISEYIQPEELSLLEDELAEKFTGALKSLVIDVERDPNSHETGRRMAKMYLHELMRGRYYPSPKVTSFPNEKKLAKRDDERPAYCYSGLLVVPAELTSMCSHHHAIVKGIAYIGILPGDKVIGLSKYVRLAQWLSRRGTLQEQLTEDLLHEIQKAADTEDVAVMSMATHGCLTCRGVEASHAYVSSAELGGRFYEEHELRSEFYRHVDMLEKQRLS